MRPKDLDPRPGEPRPSPELRAEASKRFADRDRRCLTGLKLGVASCRQGVPCGIARAIRIQACDHAVKQFGADFRGEFEHFFSKRFDGTRHIDLRM
jgi:hypothetical protein